MTTHVQHEEITNTQSKTNALQEEEEGKSKRTDEEMYCNEMPGGQSGIHPHGCRRCYHLVLLPQATDGKKQKKARRLHRRNKRKRTGDVVRTPELTLPHDFRF